MKNPFIIPLLAAISFGAAALLSELVPSLTVAMTLVSLGIAGISTLILLFSLVDARRKGQLKSTFVAAAVMAVIAIGLLLWLLPRVEIEPPITPPQTTPTGFPNA